MRRLLPALAAALALGLAAAPAGAVPTDVTVRVLAKGAKFVGTSMGGARMVIRDADTGRLMAEGVTAGGTGDTQRIMKTPRTRGTVLSTPGAARFTASLDIDRPTRLEVTVLGPLAQRQSAGRVSLTHWLVPGKPLTGGDGLVVELPGLAVDVRDPGAHTYLGGAPQTVRLSANVVMMCGCPLTPGGLWDAERFEVAARITRNGEPVGEVPLSYAGSASQFAGEFTAEAAGAYEASVYAYDPANGNTGVDSVTFLVGE